MFIEKRLFFLLILFLTLFFFTNLGHCIIKEEYDDFTGETTYRSTLAQAGPWRHIVASIGVKDGNIIYKSLYLGIYDDNWYVFENRDMDMKIDGEIVNIKFIKNIDPRVEDKLYTAAVFYLSYENIKKIKSAKEITIRVYFYNQSNITWDVTDRVLNEWKELFERVGL